MRKTLTNTFIYGDMWRYIYGHHLVTYLSASHSSMPAAVWCRPMVVWHSYWSPSSQVAGFTFFLFALWKTISTQHQSQLPPSLEAVMCPSTEAFPASSSASSIIKHRKNFHTCDLSWVTWDDLRIAADRSLSPFHCFAFVVPLLVTPRRYRRSRQLRNSFR